MCNFSTIMSKATVRPHTLTSFAVVNSFGVFKAMVWQFNFKITLYKCS